MVAFLRRVQRKRIAEQEMTRRIKTEQCYTTRLNQALLLGHQWALDCLQFYTSDMPHRQHSLLFLTNASVNIKLHLLQHSCTLLDTMTRRLSLLPPQLLSFLSFYTSDRQYLPNNFLFTFELVRLQLNQPHGYVEKHCAKSRQMMLVFFLVFRCLLLNTMHHPVWLATLPLKGIETLSEQNNLKQWGTFLSMFFFLHLKSLRLFQYLFEYHELEAPVKTYPVKEPVRQCSLYSVSSEPHKILPTNIDARNMIHQ